MEGEWREKVSEWRERVSGEGGRGGEREGEGEWSEKVGRSDGEE